MLADVPDPLQQSNQSLLPDMVSNLVTCALIRPFHVSDITGIHPSRNFGHRSQSPHIATGGAESALHIGMLACGASIHNLLRPPLVFRLLSQCLFAKIGVNSSHAKSSESNKSVVPQSQLYAATSMRFSRIFGVSKKPQSHATYISVVSHELGHSHAHAYLCLSASIDKMR